jgi:hypothetical protein
MEEEAGSLYAKEEAACASRLERLSRALTSLQEVQKQGERVLEAGGQGAVLRQFGKLKGR